MIKYGVTSSLSVFRLVIMSSYNIIECHIRMLNNARYFCRWHIDCMILHQLEYNCYHVQFFGFYRSKCRTVFLDTNGSSTLSIRKDTAIYE